MWINRIKLKELQKKKKNEQISQANGNDEEKIYPSFVHSKN